MLTRLAVLAFCVCAIAALPLSSQPTVSNNRVVFGILSQPLGDEFNALEADKHTNYIAASYVKFLESAGARVVPLPHNASHAQLEEMLSGLNGVLFPGGGADLSEGSQFFETAQHVFNHVIEANDNGQHVPMWGTCLGFQTLSILVSGNHNLLSSTDSENLTLPLEFTSEAKESRLFSHAFATPSPAAATTQSTLASLYASEPITLNNHMWSVTPSDFAKDSKLSSFYSVLSTNKDRQGKEFISTMEGKKYPVYATQWHPEKNQFEWNPTEAIAHSQDAIAAMQYIADFLVSEARKNTRSYPSDSILTSRLIYNYAPTYTGGPGKSFVQTYYDIHYV